MRTVDFAPLYRATVGFDRIADLMDRVLATDVTQPITARKAAESEDKTYLHRGIATRAFDRRFALADHVRVTGAIHEHGMLHIDLIRETPEALKPRRIEIASAAATRAPVLDAKAIQAN
jgi:molecular chaperone IbpA